MIRGALGSRYGIGALGRGVIREGASWLPTSIPGMKLWIDFSDANTLFTDEGITKVSTDAQEIYQANDKSGNGNNLLRRAPGKSATYKANFKNGLSVGLFDGVDDSMSATFTLSQPTHYFIVFKLDNTSPSYKRVFDGKSAKNSFLLSGINGTTFAMEGSVLASGLLAQDTNYHIIRCLFNGDSSKFGNNAADYNTVYIGTGNAGGVTLGDYFGYGYAANVNICEFCVYDNYISSDNETLLLNYLNDKWTIY